LSPEVIDRIGKFVFFLGYPRSGHNIIGALMDAHPHVVISGQYNLFKRSLWQDALGLPQRNSLYNSLYHSSGGTEQKFAASRDVYLLEVEDLWQGKFDKHIEVIGDSSGDVTMSSFFTDKKGFLAQYKALKTSVGIPVRVIHTLRNPFDLIATSLVLNIGKARPQKSDASENRESDPRELNQTNIVDEEIQLFFKRIDEVMKLVEVIGRENVLDIHFYDLVADSRGTLSEIFTLLGVNFTQHYLSVCSKKVFSFVSESRRMVGWTLAQINQVEMRMRKYDILSRYSFLTPG
jgi:hypothetical protein